MGGAGESIATMSGAEENSPEVEDLLKKLDEMQENCAMLQKQLDFLLNDRTETERRAIELMTNLCESQKQRYETEVERLKEIVEEDKVDKDHFERVKASVLARCKYLESDAQHMKTLCDEKDEIIEDLKDKLNREVHEEVGSLRATNSHLNAEVESLRNECEQLKTELKVEQEKVACLREENSRWKNTLDETEFTNTAAIKQLNEEVSTVKLQKADLRVRYMELEREIFRLKNDVIPENEKHLKAEIHGLQRSLLYTEAHLKDVKSKLCVSRDEVEQFRNEVVRLHKENDDLSSKAKTAEENLADYRSKHERKVEKLEMTIVELTSNNRILKDACKDLDSQCEDLIKLHNTYKYRNESLSDENQQLYVDLQKLEMEHKRLLSEFKQQRKQTVEITGRDISILKKTPSLRSESSTCSSLNSGGELDRKIREKFEALK